MEDHGLEVDEIKKEGLSALQDESTQNPAEIAEKLYRETEKIFIRLTKMCSFENADERERFLESMDGRSFGDWVQIFKSKGGLLWLKVGGHNLGPDYQPRHQHIEKLKEFLVANGDNWPKIAAEIRKQLFSVLEVARVVKRDIIYPEFKEMEARIAELEKRNKEKDSQLRNSLDTWIMLMQEISSSLRRADLRIYALLNEIGKDHNFKA